MASVSVLGREIIEAFEGCEKAVSGRPGLYTTYRDSVGVLTIGYGHTNLGNVPPKIVSGVIWTQEQCDAALANDLGATEKEVETIMREIPLTQSQFDALVSFHFNTGDLGKSSIPGKLRGGDLTGAVQTLLLYDRAGGKVLAGLTKRRQCEADLLQGNLVAAATLADVHLTSQDLMAKADVNVETA